jgi:hypothetical protein
MLEKQLIVHCAASAVRLRKYRAKKKMEQEQEQIKSTPVQSPDCNIWLPPWSPLRPPSPNHDDYSVCPRTRSGHRRVVLVVTSITT